MFHIDEPMCFTSTSRCVSHRRDQVYFDGMAATRREIGFDPEQLRLARELILRYGWNARQTGRADKRP